MVDVCLRQDQIDAGARLVKKFREAELQRSCLPYLTIEKPEAPIVKAVRKALRILQGPDDLRFQNTVIDRTMIEDAYIYRVA